MVQSIQPVMEAEKVVNRRMDAVMVEREDKGGDGGVIDGEGVGDGD